MKEMRNIKIKVDMYDDTKFKIIDTKPERDLIHYVWTRMLTLAAKVNLDGKLYLSSNIPYSDETLAIEFNRDVMQVKLSLKVFLELEMITVDDDNVYKVKNFTKYQNGNKKNNQNKNKIIKEGKEASDGGEKASANEKIKFIKEKDKLVKENNKERQSYKEKALKEKIINEEKQQKKNMLSVSDKIENKCIKKSGSNKDIKEVKENMEDEFIEFYEGDSRPLGKNEKIVMEFKV
ncbi:MAG: phage replisome organizer N-terminal domain-containing protein [Clostridium sp.]|nr:phage replisome organizer N-terminal domain-containing protein [Clostridium sp.]